MDQNKNEGKDQNEDEDEYNNQNDDEDEDEGCDKEISRVGPGCRQRLWRVLACPRLSRRGVLTCDWVGGQH